MAVRIIRDNTTLVDEYEELGPGDIILGRIRMSPGEEHVLLDLAARGIRMIPSSLSQLCSRSKVFQARILGEYMLPGTKVVYHGYDLLEVLNEYGRQGTGRVVCKLDRANAGQGVFLFNSIEDVYTQAQLGMLAWPFVVQPFFPDCQDIRVVMLGGVREAYTRHNPDNFRHNLHCGGSSTPCDLKEEQVEICRKVMARGGFPYGNVDLLVDSGGNTWLSEINLRGGLRGARISQEEYVEAVEKIHAEELAELMEQKKGEHRGLKE